MYHLRSNFDRTWSASRRRSRGTFSVVQWPPNVPREIQFRSYEVHVWQKMPWDVMDVKLPPNVPQEFQFRSYEVHVSQKMPWDVFGRTLASKHSTRDPISIIRGPRLTENAVGRFWSYNGLRTYHERSNFDHTRSTSRRKRRGTFSDVQWPPNALREIQFRSYEVHVSQKMP